MATFAYKAKKGPSQIIEDVIEAENFDQAVEKVIHLGLSPIDVIPYKAKSSANSKKEKKSSKIRVKSSDIVSLTRHLYDLVDSGVPLLRALETSSRQVTNIHFKKIVEQIRISVEEGSSLSVSLERYPYVFSPLYINMVKSGEISGKLNVVLGRLTESLEKDQEMISKARTSLIYPSLILSVGIMTVFILLTFVIPRLTEMFEDLSANLPWPTVFLMNISDFFARFWWIIVLALVAIIFYLKEFSRSTKGKLFVDQIKLNIPIIGKFIESVEIARFAGTLATLLDSGVIIVSALNSVSDILENEAFKADIKKVAKQVSAGSSLMESFQHSQFFSQTAIDMISTGEQAGRVEVSLHKLADVYEKQSDQMMKTITALLEPILIVAIGSVVGFVVIAMLLPIFQMNLMIR
ncbi:MAG: type II secretion system F family protein [Candidatus Aceula lacicola]|nr:type II secretion system F family protein [Candidatus Aceula lacicola]